MKLQLTAYKKTYTIETGDDDLGINEYFEYFKGLLISAGYHPNTVDEYIIELAEQLKEK